MAKVVLALATPGAAPLRAGPLTEYSPALRGLSNPGTMTRKPTDLDARAYELRQQGLTYRAIAKWLGVTLAMARRRVLRHERTLREGESGDRSQKGSRQ